MVEKTIRGGICHAVHRYAKAHNKYMKDYNQNKEWSFVMYWDTNNFYARVVPQILPVDDFEWDKTSLSLIRNLWKIIIKIVLEEISLMLNTLNNYSTRHTMIYNFCQREWKLRNVINLYVIFMIKKSTLRM